VHLLSSSFGTTFQISDGDCLSYRRAIALLEEIAGDNMVKK